MTREPLMASRKFVAYMVAEVAWKLLIFYLVSRGSSDAVVQQAIFWAGIGQGIYLGGQSFVDAFVRVAQAKAQAPNPSPSSGSATGTTP